MSDSWRVLKHQTVFFSENKVILFLVSLQHFLLLFVGMCAHTYIYIQQYTKAKNQREHKNISSTLQLIITSRLGHSGQLLCGLTCPTGLYLKPASVHPCCLVLSFFTPTAYRCKKLMLKIKLSLLMSTLSLKALPNSRLLRHLPIFVCNTRHKQDVLPCVARYPQYMPLQTILPHAHFLSTLAWNQDTKFVWKRFSRSEDAQPNSNPNFDFHAQKQQFRIYKMHKHSFIQTLMILWPLH